MVVFPEETSRDVPDEETAAGVIRLISLNSAITPKRAEIIITLSSSSAITPTASTDSASQVY